MGEGLGGGGRKKGGWRRGGGRKKKMEVGQKEVKGGNSTGGRGVVWKGVRGRETSGWKGERT